MLFSFVMQATETAAVETMNFDLFRFHLANQTKNVFINYAWTLWGLKIHIVKQKRSCFTLLCSTRALKALKSTHILELLISFQKFLLWSLTQFFKQWSTINDFFQNGVSIKLGFSYSSEASVRNLKNQNWMAKTAHLSTLIHFSVSKLITCSPEIKIRWIKLISYSNAKLDDASIKRSSKLYLSW